MRRGLLIFIGLFAAWLWPGAVTGKAFPPTTAYNRANPILTTTRTWDYGMRLHSIANVVDSTPVTAHSYQYDALNRRTQATLEDGSAWNYNYDDRDELTSASRQWSDASAVTGQQFGYNYDNIGNRQQSGGGASPPTTYTANSLNQYTGIVTPGLKDIIGAALATNNVTVNGGLADRHGEYFHRQVSVANTNQAVWQNVTNIAGTFTNKGGSVFPANSQTLAYDADGNLSFDGIWSYQWDGENRLAAMWMTNANGIANLATTNRLRLDFAYDYLGRRVQKIVSTWGTTNFVAQATNRFVYDGWNLLAVVNPQSAILQSFMWGQDISGTMADAGGIGGLLLANIGGTNCFAAYDGNGNITSLINATDKSLAARYEYSPYGELLRETGLLAHQMPFRFSTKFWDEESGLVYYGYRYYSSQLGRWISKDPNEEQDAINLFLAFKNSAINQIDTDGRGLFNSPKVAAVFAALATFLRAEESGNPSRGPMNDWARNMKREAQAMSESASRNMRGGSGAGGRGKPPHDYSNGGRGIVLGLAISGLYAFSESLLAAANVALGERSEQGTAGYTLESAMIHYNRGDEAWGDLDAIDAALQMSGGAGEDALIMFSVMSEAGEMFQ